MTEKFTIGTRGSELALWQAIYVKKELERLNPGSVFEIKVIKTTGDEVLDVSLSKIGDKGLFTKQIEAELLAGTIDLAVHSLKDLQTEQPKGLIIGAVCKRETPNDVLVSKTYGSIDDLPQGARVATGSLRRRSQLLHYRSDLKIEEIRGNVLTRLRRLEQSGLDGMILAYAGLHRLERGYCVRQLIPFEIMLPAVGQGAVAIEIREQDRKTANIIGGLNDLKTNLCVTAERAFLRKLEGGCQVPIGAMATLDGDSLKLEGMVGGLDGSVVFRESIVGDAIDPELLGIHLADKLIERGAFKLLDQTRAQFVADEFAEALIEHIKNIE
jgi:hydroxymethylbilane synthase